LRYGQWLRRQRRINEGKGQLRNALQVFEGLGAVDWAATARGELRAAGVSSGPSESLTAQELQVAELAAAGLSNREIGARLFLSPRTVGYHLYKVFPKLGIAARAQLRDLRTMSSTESP
jgi:DNA-binding NarL/FixJ family response regulator